jgi:hypothetical protein
MMNTTPYTLHNPKKLKKIDNFKNLAFFSGQSGLSG